MQVFHRRAVTSNGRPSPLPQHSKNFQQAGGALRACASSTTSPSTQLTLQQLQSLVQGSQRGLDTPAAVEAQILNKVADLKVAQAGRVTTTDAELSATWKLVWTTEKETLFIIKNAGLFGTKAAEVYQVSAVNCVADLCVYQQC